MLKQLQRLPAKTGHYARPAALGGTAALLLSGCGLRPAAADPVTGQGHTIWGLFGLSLVLSTLVVLLVVALLGYMLVRYRSGTPGPASEREGNRRLEVAWTAAPALLLVVLF